MGQTACGHCGPKDHGELNLRTSISEEIMYHTNRPLESAAPPLHPFLLGPIIRIQANWRRHRAKGLYRRLVTEADQSRPYFSSKEVKETVRKGQKLPAEVSTRVFVYLSQAEYQGDWLGGLRHGQGEIRYADGSVYAGGWSYGYPSGLGTFTHADGEQYIGRWTNPFPEVHQSLRVLGREAVAKWKNGLPNGYGLLPTRELDRMQQIEVKLSKLREMLARTKVTEANTAVRGKGPTVRLSTTIKYQDGGCYTGETLDGLRDGYGEMVWKNGDRYVGEWRGNKQKGWGVNRWRDGSSFVGNMTAGVGEYVWADGKRYTGEWRSNVMFGVGEHVWTDGRCYVGEYKNGLMHGYGRLTTPKGSFTGIWKLGKPKKAVN